ncbi:MAG: hypothetical protein WCR46_00035 [Deltaproteobacteria bacterium]
MDRCDICRQTITGAINYDRDEENNVDRVCCDSCMIILDPELEAEFEAADDSVFTWIHKILKELTK